MRERSRFVESVRFRTTGFTRGITANIHLRHNAAGHTGTTQSWGLVCLTLQTVVHGRHLQQLRLDRSVNFPDVLLHFARFEDPLHVACQTARHGAETTPYPTIISAGIVKIKEK